MKKRVLLVDDDASVRESLSKVLRAEGYEVVLAAEGPQAIESIARSEVDLILLDIGLPAMSGWDAFERITTEHPLVPIIVITGQASQYPMAEAAGVGALMEKPLDAPRLLQTMGELLAEPSEVRLRRLCGFSADLRHIPGDRASFLKKLRERFSTRLRLESEPDPAE